MSESANEISSTAEEDERWMRIALESAVKAEQAGEVPVGAVIVRQGKLLASEWNQPISGADPTAHAEIAVIRKACSIVTNYRIPNTTLYVTLEPCAMCVGAIVHARISRLVFGADEPKAGAVVSHSQLLENHPFNWQLEVSRGVLAAECSSILSAFFRTRREHKRIAGD